MDPKGNNEPEPRDSEIVQGFVRVPSARDPIRMTLVPPEPLEDEEDVPMPPKPDVTRPFPEWPRNEPERASWYEGRKDPYEYVKKEHVQLLTYGPQDTWLVASDGPTPFVSEPKRHTPFVVDHGEVVFEDVHFGETVRIPLTFPRGQTFGQQARVQDLLGQMVLAFDLPRLEPTNPDHPVPFWVNGVGFALLKRVRLLVEDELLDELTGEWLDVTHELDSGSQYDAIGRMVLKYDTDYASELVADRVRTAYVPLTWFHGVPEHPYLPLVAVTTSTLVLELETRSLEELIQVQRDPTRRIQVQLIPRGPMVVLALSDAPMVSVDAYYEDGWAEERDLRGRLYLDTVFLHGPERSSAKLNRHEILWKTRHQRQVELEPGRIEYQILVDDFSLLPHAPVAEVVLWIQSRTRLDHHRWFQTELDLPNRMVHAQMTVAGRDYFDVKGSNTRLNDAKLAQLHPLQYHSRVPEKPLYLFPFSLFPMDYQPSGTVNFARTGPCRMTLTFEKTLQEHVVVTVFSLYYKVVLVQAGEVQDAFMS